MLSIRYLLLFLIMAFPLLASGECSRKQHEKFSHALAVAHASGTLATLDKKYPGMSVMQILIEHSISEEQDGETIFVGYVQSFSELEKLLRSRQSEGFPEPQSRSLRRCANGVCSFDFLEGIQHNTLYLKEVRYNDYVCDLQILTIWFLDGD